MLHNNIKNNVKKGQESEGLGFFTIAVPLIVQFIAWPLFRLFFSFFMHMEVRGVENLKGLPKKALFAPNHANEIDSWIVRGALPILSPWSPMFYTTASIEAFRKSKKAPKILKKFYHSKYVREMFALWGAHPLTEGSGDYAIALKKQIQILNNNQALCLYPEGGTTRDGLLRKAHGGIVYLSEVTGAPIVPVAIKGTYKMSLHRIVKRKIKLVVTYGKPLMASDLKSAQENDYAAKAEGIMQVIKEALDK